MGVLEVAWMTGLPKRLSIEKQESLLPSETKVAYDYLVSGGELSAVSLLGMYEKVVDQVDVRRAGGLPRFVAGALAWAVLSSGIPEAEQRREQLEADMVGMLSI